MTPSRSTEALMRGWSPGTQGVQQYTPRLGTGTGVCSPLQEPRTGQAWCERLDMQLEVSMKSQLLERSWIWLQTCMTFRGAGP